MAGSARLPPGQALNSLSDGACYLFLGSSSGMLVPSPARRRPAASPQDLVWNTDGGQEIGPGWIRLLAHTFPAST